MTDATKDAVSEATIARRASRKRYRQNNPDKVRNQIAKWWNEHPDKKYDYHHNHARTPAGWAARSYSKMGERCRNSPSYVRKGIKREITKAAFKRWVESQWPLIKAHFTFHDSTGEYRDLPSLNRKDSDLSYTLDNIEIISQGQNSSRINSALNTYETKKNTREEKFDKWLAEKGDKPRSGKGHRGKRKK